MTIDRVFILIGIFATIGFLFWLLLKIIEAIAESNRERRAKRGTFVKHADLEALKINERTCGFNYARETYIGRINHLEARKQEVLFYCHPYIDQMWASQVVSMLLECDFKDAKRELNYYWESKNGGQNEQRTKENA